MIGLPSGLHQKVDFAGFARPEGVQVGPCVSNVLQGFWATFATIVGKPNDVPPAICSKRQ